MTHAAFIGTLREATLERMVGQERVWLGQDTTSFACSGHPAGEGLGTLENAAWRGFCVHRTPAVSEAGLPLGVVAQRVWVRPEAEWGKRAKRPETAFEDKESYPWVAGVPERGSGEVWAQGLTVCDREAHRSAFLAVLLDVNLDFSVRGASGRSFTLEGEAVVEALPFQPAVAPMTLQLKRRPDREAREARGPLRFGSLTLHRPKRAESTRASLTGQVVEVFEPQPPDGEEPVHGLLLTSLPVDSLQQAQPSSSYSTSRWRIERFHYTLKSGGKREASQWREDQRLERLRAVDAAVAGHLRWLTYPARLTPESPCPTALTTSPCQARYAFTHQTTRLPAVPPTLHQATPWIAQRGGFLARKRAGDPGAKVLWRGWSRLQAIVQTWLLSHPQEGGIA